MKYRGVLVVTLDGKEERYRADRMVCAAGVLIVENGEAGNTIICYGLGAWQTARPMTEAECVAEFGPSPRILHG